MPKVCLAFLTTDPPRTYIPLVSEPEGPCPLCKAPQVHDSDEECVAYLAKKRAEKLLRTTTPWACPRCTATNRHHGIGECKGHKADCSGLCCLCDEARESDDEPHGQHRLNPCYEAQCYHCGWAGQLPVPGQTVVDLPDWAKEALAAGWTPPVGWKP